jgi:hypothetical protein
MTFDRITRDKAYLSFKEFEGHFCLVTRKKKKREIFINVKRKRMLSARFRIKKNKKDENKRQRAYLCAIIILKIYKFIPKISPR